jgi:hypothetical protein
LKGGEPIGEFRWEPWTPWEVAARLENVKARWAVASGWAIDLFRGGQSREHRDIDIAVPTSDFEEIRSALAPYEFEIVGSGLRWPLTDKEAFAHTHQTWLRDPAARAYKLDLFREPHDGDVWICRRDRSIRLPYSDLIRRTPDGVPYVIPEVVLLFKARHLRPTDDLDFDAALPLLDVPARRWLAGALELVHPGHPWIARVIA